jgi:hypothetical protein
MAQKTDVVVMVDGDRYGGEIKSYADGRLRVDTNDAGEVSIKWNRIASISSDKTFDVELTDGSHIFGAFAPSTPPGKLDVVSEAGGTTIQFFAVVNLTPIYQKFLRRISGSFDLGFNYTEAKQFVQFNLNSDATYRTKAFDVTSQLSVFLSKQQDVTSSQRASLSFDYAYFLKNRWLIGGLVGAERNQDLGLDLRVSIGGGVGRAFIQTNQTRLSALLGVVANHEDPVTGEGRYNVEAVVVGQYSTFMYDFPKLTVNASLKVLPSLTDLGRVRLQADVRAQREIVSDFYVAISVFDSFDSRPPTAGAAKNDWGPVVSIGYKF